MAKAALYPFRSTHVPAKNRSVRQSPVKANQFAAVASSFCVLCLLSAQLLAVDPTGRDTDQSPADLVSLIEGARQNIERLRSLIGAGEAEDPVVASYAADELRLWEEIELVLAQRKSTLEDIEAIEHAAEPNDQATLISEDRPKSYLELDDLRDQLSSKRQHLDSLRSELQADKSMLVNTKDRHQEAEQQRRQLAEALDDVDAKDRSRLLREQSLKVLASQVLANRLDLGRDQVKLTAMRVKTCELEVTRLEATLATYTGRFRLGKEELETRLGLIKDLESRLWQHLTEVDGRMRAALHRRNSDASVVNETAYQVAHEESELLQQTLSEANQIRDCWQRRFQLSIGDVSASEISQWREEAEQARQRLSHVSEKLRLRLTQRQALLSSLGRSQFPVANPTSQSDSFPTDEAKKTNLDVAAQVEELERIVAVYQSIQLLIVSGERMYDRFIEDLKSRESQFSLAEWGHLAADGIATVWEYELTTIDDEPITVRKIVFGCLLLLCGYFISRTLASIVAHRVLPKFGLSEAGASVFRTVLFYLLLTVLTFVTLDIVSVPMTVFTFLGGAVAIGLGFGSQNLINNFMSGLILLVERPIRIGDLVNVDGIDANVTNIGARSTRVRTGANLEILVPNSKFLENNVTNWTLSDTRVRTSVSVGVAYGSPVRQVIATLRSVIGEHEQIIQTPEPIVLFQDFADSALNFEVHFWVHMKRMMDGAKIRSEVRVAIDEAFTDAGIVIAFPQRDVHIDMQSPIEVSLANPRGLVAPESVVSEAYSKKAA